MTTETLPHAPGIVEEIDDQARSGYLPLYRVIMWNDNVTTMEFVVRVLVKLFEKDYQAAENLMYAIHTNGMADVATLPLETAEFKVEQVHNAASIEQFPFTCTIELV